MKLYILLIALFLYCAILSVNFLLSSSMNSGSSLSTSAEKSFSVSRANRYCIQYYYCLYQFWVGRPFCMIIRPRFPDVLVSGGRHCGLNFLRSILSRHRRIVATDDNEIGFLDNMDTRDFGWYLDQVNRLLLLLLLLLFLVLRYFAKNVSRYVLL